MVTPLQNPGLIPPFSPLAFGYNAIALNETPAVTVVATADSEQADVSFPPSNTTTKHSASTTLDLQNGDNTITIQIVSEDEGESSTYTVNVERLGPFVSIETNQTNVTEGDTASFTLTRSGNLPGTQDVPIAFTLATDTPDHTTAAFAGAATTATVSKDTADNADWNPDKTLEAAIQQGTDHQQGTPTTAQTGVLDNDFPETSISFTVAPVEVNETLQQTTITITATTARNEQPNASRTLSITTADGSATAGEDYTALAQEIQFVPTDFTESAGIYTAAKTVQIAITDDQDVEIDDETFTVTMAAVGDISPASLIGDLTQTVTITDNDADNNANLASLELSGVTITPSFTGETVTYTGTATHDLETTTITVVPASDAAQAAISPTDDDTDTTGHQINLDPDNPTTITVVVTAQDGETTKTYTVTVTSFNQPIIMGITSLDSDLNRVSQVTEGQTINFQSTRTATTTHPQTFTFTVTQQGDFTEATSVDFTFQPSDTTADASLATVDDDKWEEHGRVTLTHQSYSSAVEVLDNDFPATGITISVDKNPIPEDDGAVTVTVKATTDAMERPHDSRTFTLRTTDGTATAGEDYTEITDTLQFDPTNFTPNGTSDYSATKTTQIAIMDDSKPETDETFEILLMPVGNASPAYVSGPNPLTVTIRENTPPPPPPPPSNNADLASLTLSNITLSPDFQADKVSYAGVAPFNLYTTVVTAVPEDDDATVVITPADTDTSTEEHDLQFYTTPRTATVLVTAQDGFTTKTYTATITKQPIIMGIAALDSNLNPVSQVTEGDVINYRLTRTATSTQPQSFTIPVTQLGDFTATTSVDFTFQPSDTTADASLATVDDDTWEEHGRITLTHQSYTSAVEVLDNRLPIHRTDLPTLHHHSGRERRQRHHHP